MAEFFKKYQYKHFQLYRNILAESQQFIGWKSTSPLCDIKHEILNTPYTFEMFFSNDLSFPDEVKCRIMFSQGNCIYICHSFDLPPEASLNLLNYT